MIHDGLTIDLNRTAARLEAEIYAALAANGYACTALNCWRVARRLSRRRWWEVWK